MSRRQIHGLFFAMLLLIPIGVLVAMPDKIRIPIVREHSKADPPDAGLFSHWAHQQYSCYSCHPAVFPQAAVGFTHDEFKEGRVCASCHNGKISWDWKDAECETCHVEEEP